MIPNTSKHQQTAHCENLAKLALPGIPCETKNLFAKLCETNVALQNLYFGNLAKLLFAKPCETNVKLQKLYLQNPAKLIFAKVAKHYKKKVQNTNYEICISMKGICNI